MVQLIIPNNYYIGTVYIMWDAFTKLFFVSSTLFYTCMHNFFNSWYKPLKKNYMSPKKIHVTIIKFSPPFFNGS